MDMFRRTQETHFKDHKDIDSSELLLELRQCMEVVGHHYEASGRTQDLSGDEEVEASPRGSASNPARAHIAVGQEDSDRDTIPDLNSSESEYESASSDTEWEDAEEEHEVTK